MLSDSTYRDPAPRRNGAPGDARRVAIEFGEAAVYHEVDTAEHATVAEWGLADALFVDGKQVMTGPPISPGRLRKIVRNKVARL